MTVHIDLDKAKSLVAESLAERGEDYVYEKEAPYSCRYVHNIVEIPEDDDEYYYKEDFTEATPGCLVGMALNKAGIELVNLGGKDRNEEGSFELLNKLAEDGLITFTDQASNYLGNAQSSQDCGAPWGRAVNAALRGKVLEPEFNELGEKTGDFTESDNYPVL